MGHRRPCPAGDGCTEKISEKEYIKMLNNNEAKPSKLKRGMFWTPEKDQFIFDSRKNGDSFDTIAKALGVSSAQTVANRMQKIGMADPKPVDAKRHKPVETPPDVPAQVEPIQAAPVPVAPVLSVQTDMMQITKEEAILLVDLIETRLMDSVRFPSIDWLCNIVSALGKLKRIKEVGGDG
jgi:hypothetical protein